MVEKSNTFKILTFEGTGLWKLYHKQFEAAAAHNQLSDAEKAVPLTTSLHKLHTFCMQPGCSDKLYNNCEKCTITIHWLSVAFHFITKELQMEVVIENE